MSGIYTSFLQKALTGQVDLQGGTITAYLLTSGYVPNYGSHDTLADVPTAAREEQATVGGKQVEGGTFRAAPTTFAGADGAAVKAVLLVHAGTDLVCYVDDFGAGPGNTSLALNGSDVTVNWAAAGIFTLG